MAGTQSYYNVTITNSNTNSSPNDGFIDNLTIQNYGQTSLETTPSGWTLATCTAKRRGNVRYQEIIEQIGLVTIPSILIGSISSNATATTEATSFGFTVMIQHGDASLITADELNIGQYLTSTSCLQRCIARALTATVYKEIDIFDPTESTTTGSYGSTSDVIRFGPRIYTSANFEVGPYGTSLSQVTPYITVTQSNYWFPWLKWLSVFLIYGCALTLSGLAGMVSIMGMMALFASDGWMIGVIMGTLEASKLVAAGWIHANWKNPAVSFLHKSYFLLAVIVLMLITGIGIYGYLSKGYLDQRIPMGEQSLQISQRERQIETDKQNIQRLNDRQNQLDAAVNSMIAQKYVNRSQIIRSQQKKERDQIAIDLDQNQKDIDRLSSELIPLKMATQNVEAKLGPIKFVADLFGWTHPDTAVRMVILMIMFAFDPLAIMLILSGSISVREKTFIKKPERVLISTRKYESPQNKTVEQSSPDDLSDKQEILKILQRNPNSIEDVIDTVLEWHEQYLKKEWTLEVLPPTHEDIWKNMSEVLFAISGAELSLGLTYPFDEKMISEE